MDYKKSSKPAKKKKTKKGKKKKKPIDDAAAELAAEKEKKELVESLLAKTDLSEEEIILAYEDFHEKYPSGEITEKEFLQQSKVDLIAKHTHRLKEKQKRVHSDTYEINTKITVS